MAAVDNDDRSFEELPSAVANYVTLASPSSPSRDKAEDFLFGDGHSDLELGGQPAGQSAEEREEARRQRREAREAREEAREHRREERSEAMKQIAAVGDFLGFFLNKQGRGWKRGV